MKNVLTILVPAILMIACQKNEGNSEARINKAFENERIAFFNNLKAPTEVAATVQGTAAEFNARLMHDPTVYSSYSADDIKAAANLGIYLSDLNYSVAFKQSSSTSEFFQAAHDLSKVIGLEQSILDFLMQRYSENINQNDSVKAVIDELFAKSTTRLQGTDREKLVGIAMAAYQIENLHLVLGTIESIPNDRVPDDDRINVLAPLFKTMLEQRTNVEIIYGFLKSIGDPLNPEKNPNYAYYANAFEELLGVYKKLNAIDTIGDDLAITLLNDAVIMELHDRVEAIRNKIISI